MGGSLDATKLTIRICYAPKPPRLAIETKHTQNWKEATGKYLSHCIEQQKLLKWSTFQLL